ncbi:MAG: outer membrane protein assembly factor BamB family protein, partial [Planctomycetota bacterium]
MNRRRLITMSVAGLCAGWLAWAGTAGALESARDVRDATGITGGLVVHVGCGDGGLAAALSAQGKYLVCGLDADADDITKARARVRAAGGRGRATVERWSQARLPFVDNLVNLVVGEDLGAIPMDEVMRVLAPGGVAYVKKAGRWSKSVKPRPTDIDEWTHFLHGPDGNAVAHDTVAGPPRHMQWTAAPTWSRNHHKLASISSVVTTRGRLFYILDEAPAASMKLPGKWSVVARDAFNGVLLWKRPMSSWAYHGHGFRNGPVQLPRTLVAAGERVYAPLGMSAPVSAVDAATGEIARTYESTKGAEEIILADGVLYVVTGSPLAEQAGIDPALRGKSKFPNDKSIVAIRAGTGEELWRWQETGAGKLMPLTLAADGARVFFQLGKGVVSLDAASG